MARSKKNKSIDREQSRYGLFMSEESFNLDLSYGRHYLQQDVQFKIKLYRINIIETKSHDLYGQAKPKDKKFFTPVELDAMVDIEDNNQSQYAGSEGGLVREDTGNLVARLYLQELEEKGTEVNRGDIIEYNPSGDRPRYYEVENAQNVTDTTQNSRAGFRAYWKRVLAVPVKEDVTPYLSDDKLV
jgi:hypothetical protein